MGIHFLHCTHGNEHIGIHDAVCNTFVTIVRNASFHVGWGQLQALFSTILNSSYSRVDIVFTKDGICILIDIVIVDPMRANIFLRSFTTQRFVAFDVIQTKERNYYDQHPTNRFLSLAIEVFGCLHKQANVLLHKCANAIWSLKG